MGKKNKLTDDTIQGRNKTLHGMICPMIANRLFKLTFVILILTGYSWTIVAQTISGRVRDSHNGASVPDVFIYVSNATGTITVLSDSLGDFEVIIPGGENVAEVCLTHIVYDTVRREMKADSLYDIYMVPKKFTLSEVVVRSEYITRKDGESIVNVKAIPGVDKMQTDQLLRYIPGIVQVGKGSYNLYGKPVTVFIDGVEQRISAASLDAFLSALPAGALASVKLVPVNTGKYSSSVEAVIDIKTDGNMPLGSHIQTGVLGSLRDGQMEEGGTDIFYMRKYKKLFFYTTFSYSNENARAEGFDSLYAGRDKTVATHTWQKGRGNVFNYQAGMRWLLESKNHFNVNLFVYGDFFGKETQWLSSKRNVFELRNNRSDLYNLSLSYHIPSAKKHFNGVATYSVSYGGRHTDMYYPANREVGDGDLDMEGWMHNLSADFNSTIGECTFLYGGQVDYNSVWDRTFYSRSLQEGDKYIFTGSEFLISSYFQIRYRFNDVLGLQGGLRVENTLYEYDDSAQQHYRSSYTDLFPTLALFLDMPDYHLLVGALSNTVRPKYEFMLPGLNKVNDYIYRKGNPNLKPTNCYRFILYNTFFNFLQLNFEYIYIKNAMGTVHTLQDGRLIRSYDNICDTHFYEVNMTLPFSFLNNRFSGQVQGSAIYKNIGRLHDGITLPDGRHGHHWLCKADAVINYNPTDRLSIGVSAAYRPKQITAFFDTRSQLAVGGNLTYAFLKKKNFLLDFKVSDLFRTGGQSISYFLDKKQISENCIFGPVFELGVRWKFNKGQKVIEEYEDYTPKTGRFR